MGSVILSDIVSYSDCRSDRKRQNIATGFQLDKGIA